MKTHAVAKCRWCGGPFQKVYERHWICMTPACADRCIAEAIAKKNHKEPASPWFFLPLPFQVDVEFHMAQRLLVHGAAGVSKSFFGRWYAYKRCMRIPGFRALLIRCTYDQLNKNHLQFIEYESKMLAADGYKCKWTPPGSSPNARQFHFFHGDDPEARLFMGYCQDEGDIAQHVGPEWDLVLLEEGVTLLVKAIREIMGRDRGADFSRFYREKLGMMEGQTRILTNPGGRAMNYLNDMFIAKAPPPDDFKDYDPQYYANVSGAIADNPYLSENYAATSLGHLDKARAAQLKDGRWDVFEGQFFQSFNEKIHVQAIEAE